MVLTGEPSVKPPGGKPPRKKAVLWYGGAGLASLAVVWWVMRKRAAAQQPDLSQMDPNGYSAAPGGPSQQAGYIDPGTGAYIGGLSGGSVGSIFGPSTNAAWAQQAEAYLTSIQYDSVATAAALGKYLTGQTLSDDQKTIVQAALGFFGAPPNGAPPVSSAPPGGQTNDHPGFWPPLVASGPGIGQAGGYWWTPASEDLAANFALAAYGPNTNPGNESSFRSRIMQLNPQIDWSQDFRALVNTPMFIPVVTIGGAGTAHNEQPWPLPPGASLNAPAGYHPH